MILKRIVVGGGGGGSELPFTASYNTTSGEMSVTGGYYFQSNLPISVPALDATLGVYAYLQIGHTSAGVLDPNAVILVVTETPLNYTEYDVDNTFIEYTNFLIADYSGDTGFETLNQYASGNVELVYGFTNGDIHLVPIFSGGKI